MRILLLGCLSHLGINFIKYLNENKYDIYIVGIDKISYCSQSYSLLDKFKINVFIQSDILKLDLTDIIETHNLDIIINCAGETHVDRSYTHFSDFINSNVLLVEHIMKSVISLNKTNKKIKLIHLSTDEVYGDNYISQRKEIDMANPTNPYSASKASGDMIITGYYNSYNLKNNVICLRPNNLCGLYQYSDKVIPLFYNKSKNNESVLIHGNGRQRRNFILTTDVCKIILLICFEFKQFISIKNKYNSSNPFLNVSTDDNLGVSIIDLAILFKKEIGNTAEIVFSKDRLYNDKYYMISNEILIKILHNLLNLKTDKYSLCVDILIGLRKKTKYVVLEVINQMQYL
jgi:dTDP-glucose 4,6-dehydratase